MSGEQRGPAVSNLPTTLRGRDERKIYLEAKTDKAGTGGVGPGFIGLLVYSTIIESSIIRFGSAASLRPVGAYAPEGPIGLINL